MALTRRYVRTPEVCVADSYFTGRRIPASEPCIAYM
jgi:hypothetical protein